MAEVCCVSSFGISNVGITVDIEKNHKKETELILMNLCLVQKEDGNSIIRISCTNGMNLYSKRKVIIVNYHIRRLYLSHLLEQ